MEKLLVVSEYANLIVFLEDFYGLLGISRRFPESWMCMVTSCTVLKSEGSPGLGRKGTMIVRYWLDEEKNFYRISGFLIKFDNRRWAGRCSRFQGIPSFSEKRFAKCNQGGSICDGIQLGVLWVSWIFMRHLKKSFRREGFICYHAGFDSSY